MTSFFGKLVLTFIYLMTTYSSVVIFEWGPERFMEGFFQEYRNFLPGSGVDPENFEEDEDEDTPL